MNEGDFLYFGKYRFENGLDDVEGDLAISWVVDWSEFLCLIGLTM